jgi:riboflavin synthase
MFTGLIERTGIVKSITTRGNYNVLTIGSEMASDNIQKGESICCDGVCLTVVTFTKDAFIVEVSQETSARSILNSYKVGSKINLERALHPNDRLGGHWVSGHVDCVGKVDYLKPVGESLELAVIFDSNFDLLVVEKGSIALNGVSLTVNAVRSGWVVVNLIPFTQGKTTLEQLRKEDPVNIEFDIIGKYIVKMNNKNQSPVLTKEKLTESGW